MNYREAHRILDRSYTGIRRARVWMCWLLAAIGLIVCVVGSIGKDPGAAFGGPIVCLLLAFLWWSLCSFYMVLIAGIHAMITSARAQAGDEVDADTHCGRPSAKASRPPDHVPCIAPTAGRGSEPGPVQPTQHPPDRVLGQRPGESLEAWAKRTEEAEMAAFKARSRG